MKKFLTFLLLFLIGLTVVKNTNLALDPARLLTFSYCDKPVHFRVDTVDSKFNLSRGEFVTDVNQAVNVWNKAEGKDLFIYDPKGELSVNMVYDQRQSLTTQINQLENTLQNNQQSLKPQINQYKKDEAAFKQKLDDFNKQVADWNSRGGAPPDQYDKLVSEQQDLKAEAGRLKQVAEQLNQSTDVYNSQVTQLNQTVQTFNQELYCRPEEGLFMGPQDRIEVYFNVSKVELIHTLAHELGHALGLGHVENAKAIMYSKTNQQLVPTSEDLADLQEVCKPRSIFEPLLNYLSRLKIQT